MHKLTDKRIVVPFILLIYALLIILPPIIHHYIYPTGGTDTAYHLIFLDQLKQGNHPSGLYWGQYIVGYPIVWLSNIVGVSIDRLFFWFNYGVLVGIELAVFFVVSKFVNWRAGLIAVPIVIFSQSVLNMFDDGTIFELVILGIVLPLFLYSLVKALKTRKVYWVALAVGVVGFTLIFHLAGAIILVAENSEMIAKEAVFSRWDVLVSFFTQMIGIPTLTLLLLFVFVVADVRKWADNRNELSMAIGALVVLLAGLAILAFGIGKLVPIRVTLDMAVIISLLAAMLAGLAIKSCNQKSVSYFFAIVVMLASIPYIVQYYGYHSAVTPADEQAIAYVKDLGGVSFSCSSEVDPVIYGRYLGVPYKKDSDVYIQRSKPMTYQTTPGTVYYLGDKNPPDYSLHLVASYSFQDTIVSVYDK